MMNIQSNETNEITVDVDVYLPFMKSLIAKYGNFKVSADLHNDILRYLAKICQLVEDAKDNE